MFKKYYIWIVLLLGILLGVLLLMQYRKDNASVSDSDLYEFSDDGNGTNSDSSGFNLGKN